jgi:hypothetical protein
VVVISAVYQIFPAFDSWQHGRIALPGFLIVGWDNVTRSCQNAGKSGCMSFAGHRFNIRSETLQCSHFLWHGRLVNA